MQIQLGNDSPIEFAHDAVYYSWWAYEPTVVREKDNKAAMTPQYYVSPYDVLVHIDTKFSCDCVITLYHSVIQPSWNSRYFVDWGQGGPYNGI